MWIVLSSLVDGRATLGGTTTKISILSSQQGRHDSLSGPANYPHRITASKIRASLKKNFNYIIILLIWFSVYGSVYTVLCSVSLFVVVKLFLYADILLERGCDSKFKRTTGICERIIWKITSGDRSVGREIALFYLSNVSRISWILL